jgi:membrane protease subunit HflK
MTRKKKAFPVVFQGLEAGLRMFRWVVVVLLLLFCFSGVTRVPPGSVGLVLRFGKLAGATRVDQIREPGLVLALPYPIDQVIEVPVKEEGEVTIEEVYYPYDETPPTTDLIDPVLEGYCLTGDQNLIQAKLVVKYKITDPIAFALGMADADRESLLRDAVLTALTHTVAGWEVDEVIHTQRAHVKVKDMTESLAQTVLRDAVLTALTHTVAGWEVDEVIHTQRADMKVKDATESLAETIRRLAQERLDALAEGSGCGLEISAVQFKEIHPPRHVKADFERVQMEVSDAMTKMQNAKAFAARTIPNAEAQRNQLIQEARAYQSVLTGEATAEVEEFGKVYEEYKNNPELVWQRMYEETVERVLKNVGRRVFLSPGTKPILPGEGQP